jgi:tripartite-type tricarboxylate transporter receptor subunit TctC
MRYRIRRHLALCSLLGVGIVCGLLSATDAWSQPSRTIKVVVPFPPGGGVDILARIVADHISRSQKVTLVIENRPGAGTLIATEAVARAPADGNTILFVANSFIINPALRKISYDPLTTFVPACLLTRSPNVIAVNPSSPYQTLTDYLNDARAKRGQLQMAFQGPATSQHIATEKLKRAANIELINVPFPGAAPAVNALSGGHITALFVNYPSIAGQVTTGKARVLASGTRSRLEMHPNVPTIAEVVGTNYEEDVWIGAAMPAKTPASSVNQISDWMRDALSAQDVRSKLTAQGLDAAGTCGAEFGGFLREQLTEYTRVIADAKIREE